MNSVHRGVKTGFHRLPLRAGFAKRLDMTSHLPLALCSLDETRDFGRRIAARLGAGDVVFLTGGLGAGKTTLARAIIEALCGVSDAPSPTYTIVQTYETESGTPLWHADLYRIEEEAELEELGLDDAFEDAICLIEWPDRLGEWCPQTRLEIDLSMPGQDDKNQDDNGALKRQVRITGRGDWETRLDDI
ncbi:tRNA (adenosine(37)-N6)-threonylcarbamoyltransferase complex ATPase subunit type 1 TsaE [Maricaulis sp.]|uniref:tRNA (adenosine(37)-N6)-threonylcarbamoyltransferase complex ATPase subunit type 1 TsaE n=1 Tax=Maricaulis sp. TaxID=1486257 RepID=UPI0026283B54|nr:tRNA (adenosine(37)-N6)-threonylcarbamoyltransferase complex ATPase subunit type 1 TsaE [Maricaulis sp.]